MKIILASNNKNKMREFRELLAGTDAEPISQRDAGCDFEVDETGTTFEEHALIKANYVMNTCGQAAIADDSGLEVDALNGEPGVYSARYCGRHGDDEANNELLLKNLAGVQEPRRARYVAAIALVRPGHEPIIRRGTCEGEILTERRGTGGFGYDPLFLCETGETFAQITPETKNAISHRKRGIEAVLRALEEEE